MVLPDVVTIVEYLGSRRQTHASEWHPDYQSNANNLLAKVNLLIDRCRQMGLTVPWKVTSGWRPRSVNAAIGGAPNSHHVVCRAVDFLDNDRKIGLFLNARPELLRAIGLAMEDLAYCVKADGQKWVHLQSVMPPSGRVIFVPYSGPPRLT